MECAYSKTCSRRCHVSKCVYELSYGYSPLKEIVNHLQHFYLFFTYTRSRKIAVSVPVSVSVDVDVVVEVDVAGVVVVTVIVVVIRSTAHDVLLLPQQLSCVHNGLFPQRSVITYRIMGCTLQAQVYDHSLVGIDTSVCILYRGYIASDRHW